MYRFSKSGSSVFLTLYLSFNIHIQDYGILALPTVPGPPPKLQTEPSSLEIFRAKAFSLLSIAGVSGFCQVIFLSTLENTLSLMQSCPFGLPIYVFNNSDLPLKTGKHTTRNVWKSSYINFSAGKTGLRWILIECCGEYLWHP